MCTDILETKELLSNVIKKKFDVKVKLIHTPSQSIRPIFNLCKINAKQVIQNHISKEDKYTCLLYTSPSPRDRNVSRMPSSA